MWCCVSGHGGRADVGRDCVTGVVRRDDLPVEIRGQHGSVRALKGQAMNAEIYFRELDGPVILEAKQPICSVIFLLIT